MYLAIVDDPHLRPAVIINKINYNVHSVQVLAVSKYFFDVGNVGEWILEYIVFVPIGKFNNRACQQHDFLLNWNVPYLGVL